MKAAIISPVPLLPLTKELDYHLVLAQLFQNTKYREFYSNVSGYKILDNGAAENQRVPTSQLMAVAHELQVHEVVVPDILFDTDNTLRMASTFGQSRYFSPNFRYMGVLQGKNMAELAKCARAYMYRKDLSYIDVLGVPRHVNRTNRQTRAGIVEVILNDEDLSKRFKEIHCLGASQWLKEPAILSALPVRGIDTSAPVVLGLEGIPINNAQYMSRPSNYFDIGGDLDEQRKGVIIDNVRRYLDWCGAETPALTL